MTETTAPRSMLDVALEAHTAGLAVVPPKENGTKAPDGRWKTFQAIRPDETQLRSWYGDGRRHGLGVLTGAVSGNLEMLELEGRAAHQGLWSELVAEARASGLDPLLERIIAGYAELTPSGGVHLIYRCTAPVDGNMKLAREVDEETGEVQVLIETRGEGGYVVVAPSRGPVHPTGEPWRLKSGGFATIATITPDERTQLLDLAASFDRMPDAKTAPTAPAEDHIGTVDTGARSTTASPRSDTASWMDETAADFNRRTTWADILGPHGWTEMRPQGGVGYWCRPGKNPRDGHSATVNAKGTDRLILFSTSVHIPGVDSYTGAGDAPSYDRFHVWAGYHHAGDRQVAAVALRKTGYGPAWVDLEDVDLHTLIAGDKPTSDPSAVGEPWPDPVPLGTPATRLPPFPVDVLPQWLAAQAADVAHQLQVPVDLPALLGLGALATVVAGKLRLKVTDGWTEHLNLYLAVAMPPSSGKSPAAKAMFAPVETLEAELGRAHAQVAAEAAQRKRIAEKRAKQLEDQAARSGDTTATDAAVKAFIEAEAAEVPKPPRLLSDDATPEALTAVLAEHGGRITIASTEGGLFELMTGRYSDGRANLDVYLKAWSADAIRVDRIGRAPVHIPEPVVSVVLAIQPEVLRALAERPELAGRGLTARFLYALPIDLVGARDLTTPRPADAAVRTAYREQVLAIGRSCASWQMPADLLLDVDAGRLYGAWRQTLEERRRPDGDLRAVAEWTGKLEAAVLRLAALLHIADGRLTRDQVDTGTLARALKVGEYWLAHAIAVHQLWDGDRSVGDAQAVIEWLQRTGASQFAARALDVGVNRFRGERQRMEDAVGRLIDSGWLRTSDGAPLDLRRGRGKRQQSLLVHPDLDRHARAYPREPNARAETNT